MDWLGLLGRAEMSKIVPIGGTHSSAHSMLAEVMSDPNVESCVVVTFGPRDGSAADVVGWGMFKMSALDLCYAAELVKRLAFDDPMP
jgi:hypothetical protein